MSEVPEASPSSFTPTLKSVRADERGRLSLGSAYPPAKGRVFNVAVDHLGRVLLTPKEGDRDE